MNSIYIIYMCLCVTYPVTPPLGREDSPYPDPLPKLLSFLNGLSVKKSVQGALFNS